MNYVEEYLILDTGDLGVAEGCTEVAGKMGRDCRKGGLQLVLGQLLPF